MSESAESAPSIPPAGTVERWAFDYVRARTLDEKLSPPKAPEVWESPPTPRRIPEPGRPPELPFSKRKLRAPRGNALLDPSRRAQLLHVFFHHEFQAAELFAWSLLAFPETPLAFKKGILRIFDDELGHMAMYLERVQSLGHRIGDWPVNDYFWSRMPQARDPIDFVATMGMGLEGGNLDHAARFAAIFRKVGDEASAKVAERIAEEEISHAAFGLHWFEQWTGSRDFDRWRRHLPAPLTPLMMKGEVVDRAARRRAGFGEDFLDSLEAWNRDSGRDEAP